MVRILGRSNEESGTRRVVLTGLWVLLAQHALLSTRAEDSDYVSWDNTWNPPDTLPVFNDPGEQPTVADAGNGSGERRHFHQTVHQEREHFAERTGQSLVPGA